MKKILFIPQSRQARCTSCRLCGYIIAVADNKRIIRLNEFSLLFFLRGKRALPQSLGRVWECPLLSIYFLTEDIVCLAVNADI